MFSVHSLNCGCLQTITLFFNIFWTEDTFGFSDLEFWSSAVARTGSQNLKSSLKKKEDRVEDENQKE